METDDGRTRQTRSDGQAGRTAERRAPARRTMWRSRIIERCGHPASSFWNHLEDRGGCGLWYCEVTCRYLDSGVIQPDHVSVIVTNLGPVVIVRCGMSMDNGMRVMGIRFVDVLRWSDRREREARHGDKSNSRAPERMHACRLWVGGPGSVKPSPPPLQPVLFESSLRSHLPSGTASMICGTGQFSLSRTSRAG